MGDQLDKLMLEKKKSSSPLKSGGVRKTTATHRLVICNLI